MKKIILIALLISLPLSTVLAQGKLINNSGDRPAWVKRDVSKYDIMKVSASSEYGVDQAKKAAFKKLEDVVILNISKYMSEIAVGDFDLAETKARVAASQYVRNIDEATSIETYWEHRRVKKHDVFTYYILYNFNDFEKKKVVLELDKKDNASRFEDNF